MATSLNLSIFDFFIYRVIDRLEQNIEKLLITEPFKPFAISRCLGRN